MVHMAFPAEMVSVLVLAVCVGQMEVYPCLCASTVSADALRRHFGKDSIRWCGSNDAWPGVIVSQASHFHSQETQVFTYSLLRLWGKVY
ncbi:MAG: hypothetical protein QOF85_2790 [Solirubrobacterales bacterium]|nr:hypothetical protein [Solirubrobacterales bacterium]